jgi:hypothetical protein
MVAPALAVREIQPQSYAHRTRGPAHSRQDGTSNTKADLGNFIAHGASDPGNTKTYATRDSFETSTIERERR